MVRRSQGVCLLLILLQACSDKSGTDTSDPPSETDTSGETGEKKEEPIVYTSMAGTIHYVTASNGVATCDADIAITSRPYTGDCDDCDFAFYLDAEVTREEGDCAYFPLLSFLPGDWGGIEYRDLFLVHFPTYDAGGGYVFYNMLQAGYSAAVSGYDYPGPYYWTMGYGGGFYGRTTFRDLVLTNDFYYFAPAYVAYNSVYYDGCGDKAAASTENQAQGGVSATSRLTCDGLTADAWTFELAQEGPLAITVDTLADATAFDPLVVINGPDGCTQVLAQDNFLCSYPPPTYLCPAWSEPRAEPGVWTAVVLNMGSCNGSEAEYAISVDGVAGLSLLADDFQAWTSYGDSFLLTALLEAQLTTEEE